MRLAIVALGLVFVVLPISAETIDTDFGDNGYVVTTFLDPGTDLLLQVTPIDAAPIPGNAYLAIGQSDDGNNLVAARYLANGDLDTGYADGGRLVIPIPPTGITQPIVVTAMKVAPDGGFLAAVIIPIDPFPTGGFDYELWRYGADGTADTSFGTDGELTLESPVDRIAFDSVDRLLLLSYPFFPDRQTIVQRRFASGEPDLSFGGDGRVIFESDDLGGRPASSLTSLTDGRIALGGGSEAPGGGAGMMAMLEPDGDLDLTWGDGGVILATDIGVEGSDYRSIRARSDGWVIGSTNNNPPGPLPPYLGMLVIRADGTVDPRIGPSPPNTDPPGPAGDPPGRAVDIVPREDGGYLFLSGTQLLIYHLDETATVTPAPGFPDGTFTPELDGLSAGHGMTPANDGATLVFGTFEGSGAPLASFLLFRLESNPAILDIPTLSGLGYSLLALLLGAAALIAMRRRG
ncbi:MAG: hypothetical protein AAGD38_22415 [Acidobacteriota bacterium]